jgi:chromosome segregation ATPase
MQPTTFPASISRSLISGLVITLLAGSLAGCATSSGPVTPGRSAAAPGAYAVALTDAEKRLRANERRFNDVVTGAVLQNAVIGAGIGAVTALMSGRRGQDVAAGAAIGAVAGGALGAYQGYTRAKLEQQKMNIAATYNSIANDIRQQNDRWASDLGDARAVHATSVKELQSLQARARAGTVQVAEQRAQFARFEENHKVMQRRLEVMRKEQAQYEEALAKLPRDAEAERALAEQQLAVMRNSVGQLQAQVASLGEALTTSRV